VGSSEEKIKDWHVFMILAIPGTRVQDVACANQFLNLVHTCTLTKVWAWAHTMICCYFKICGFFRKGKAEDSAQRRWNRFVFYL